MKNTVRKVEIYTDGACKGTPGVAGSGALVLYDGHTQELFGGEVSTTNNQMELMAAIRALQALESLPIEGEFQVHLFTDSQYVQKGISEWIENWKKRGWRTADRKPVKNEVLWKMLDQLSQRYPIEWCWV